MEFGFVTTTRLDPSVGLRELALGPVKSARRETAQTPPIYFEPGVTDEPEPTYGPDGRRVGAAEAAPSTEASEIPAETRTSEAPEAESAKDGTPQEEDAGEATRPRGVDGEPLSDEELHQVEQMAERDREVRAHEQAHKAVGGKYAGAISYDYERGPDGKTYAVGGEVQIDLSEVDGDPESTIRKMQQVRRAALAPAEPSAQDRRVAAEASQLEAEARTELRELKVDEREASTVEPEPENGTKLAEDVELEDRAPVAAEKAGPAETEQPWFVVDRRVRIAVAATRRSGGVLSYRRAAA